MFGQIFPANLPDFPGGDHDATDPFTIQGGYDLFIAVKPTDPNFVSAWWNKSISFNKWFCIHCRYFLDSEGYGNTLPTLTFYANSHPDIHNVAFNPGKFQ
jgi:hypothetical protein